MRRNIFHDKTNTTYGNRENKLSNDIFQRNFEPFKFYSRFQQTLHPRVPNFIRKLTSGRGIS